MIDPSLTLRLVIGAYRLARRRIQTVGSTNWSMANGRVHDGKLVNDELQGWAAELTYSYSAMGEYYSGSYRRGFRRKKKAEAFLERLPRDTPLPVRYKPGNPSTSTLLLTDLGLLLAGL